MINPDPANWWPVLSIHIPFLLALLLLNGLWVVTRLSFVKSSQRELEKIDKGLNLNKAQTLLNLKKSSPRVIALLQLASSITTLLFGGFLILALSPILDSLRSKLEFLPGFSSFLGTLILVAVSLFAITPIHLFFTDLFPRWLTRQAPEKLALKTLGVIQFLGSTLAPIWKVFHLVFGLCFKPFGVALPNPGSLPTEEEILTMVEGSDVGRDRVHLIEKAMDFAGKTAKEVMIPRHQIACLDLDKSMTENLAIAKECGHTRLPLVKKEIELINSYVNIKDILWLIEANHDVSPESLDLEKIAREIVFIPEGKLIQELLQEFQLQKAHMALVVDEYGMISGLVTLEDVLEELVGEIRDEFDKEPSKIQKVTKDCYIIDGTAHLDEIEEHLHLEFPIKEDDTLGGYFLTRFENMPRKGDRVEDEDFKLEVLELRGKRLSKIRLTLLDPSQDQGQKFKSALGSLKSFMF